MNQEKKNVLITGASSGIGFELAKILSQDNAVYSLDLKKPDVENTEWKTIIADITKPIMYHHAMSLFGPFEIVIHCAAVKLLAEKDYQRMITINGSGPKSFFNEVRPHLTDNGQMIYLSSDLIKHSSDDKYSLSKKLGHAGIKDFQEKNPNLTIKIAYLGPVDTPLFRDGKSKRRIKEINPATAEYAAKKIIELIDAQEKTELVCLNDIGTWTHELQ